MTYATDTLIPIESMWLFNFFRFYLNKPVRIGSEQIVATEAVLCGVRTEHPLLDQIIEFTCFEK